MLKRICSLILVLLLVAALGASAFAEDALPDIDIHDSLYMLASTKHGVGPYCAANFGSLGLWDGQGFDARMFDDMIAMINDCRSAGNSCFINLGSRDWGYNVARVDTMLASGRYEDVQDFCSRDWLIPGCNEHQIGLGIDITQDPAYSNEGFDYNDDAQYSDAWAWMREHCSEYGFIVRYPEGKEDLYGVPCHPTHLRYVGHEAARYITDHNLCLEEFIALYE